jgi:hypothetical protein
METTTQPHNETYRPSVIVAIFQSVCVCVLLFLFVSSLILPPVPSPSKMAVVDLAIDDTTDDSRGQKASDTVTVMTTMMIRNAAMDGGVIISECEIFIVTNNLIREESV